MDFDKAYDKLDWVREQLESTVSNSRVELMPSDMGDFFITVTQRNETTGNDNTWSFCVNIDDNYVQMLEPAEDEEHFTNITEVFSIIKSFLNGGSSREKRFGNKIDSSKKPIKSSLSDVNKALGFTDKDIEEDGKIHITTDLGEFVVDYVNDEYIVSYDGEERIFTEYKDTVEEVVELFNQLCSEEVKLFNKNINSSKPIKSSAEPTKYDYHFFYNKLKNSPYFEEYVVRYDDDAGEDNIHTKQNIPVTIIFPDGKRTECPSCYVQFYQSGWRFVAEGVMSGKESYSEIKDVTFTSENVIIMDSDGFTFDFLYDNIAIKSSRKPIKSSADPIDELERRAHYALPYDNDITILNRDDKLVIKVALKDDIKRIRAEDAANKIFARLQGDNRFMQMLDNLVHNDKEVVCIVYDPDSNERIASINF